MSLGLIGSRLKGDWAGVVGKNGKEVRFIGGGSEYLFLK